jgi:hypothetical protein
MDITLPLDQMTLEEELDTATGSFSLSPPAERGERGANAGAKKGGGGFPAWRSPLSVPLLKRRRGRSSRRLVAVSNALVEQGNARGLTAARQPQYGDYLPG